MGGGASKEKDSTLVRSTTKIKRSNNPRAVFQEHHEYYQTKISNNTFVQKLVEAENYRKATYSSMINFAKETYESFKGKKDALAAEDLEILFNELVGETFLRKYLEVPSYDIFKVINQIFTGYNLPEDQAKAWKTVVEKFQKEFEMIMKTNVYSFEKELKDMDTRQLIGMNSNLKYHSNYESRIITVIINKKFLENKVAALDLGDVIAKSSKLQIVIFILYPTDANDNIEDNFGFDASDYNIIYHLFNGVANNRNIKALFFHSVKDYRIIIAPEISNLIIKKLQSETLIAFHLGYFMLSADYYKKLMFQIICTRSMLFLSLHVNSKVGFGINHIFAPVIEKNNSLLAFVLTGLGPEYQKQIDDFKERLMKQSNPLDFLYVGEQPIIRYPFQIKK